MSHNYKKKFSLENKSAIVTGGAGILGQRFCSGLAEFRANVAIVDINQNVAADLASRLASEYNVKSISICCDITDPAAVSDMVDHVVSEFGEINVLHNNAAFKGKNLAAFFETFENYSLEQWREVMTVNIDAMFLVAQAVGRQMVKQGKGGSIIQTSSIYGIMGPDQRIYTGSNYLGHQINTPAVYSASKAAVVGLTKFLATYWADRGIRVNTLTPGGNESGQNEVFKKHYSARIPLGRMAQPDEMVGALIYLASDASSYVTGQNIVLDGGLSAW